MPWNVPHDCRRINAFIMKSLVGESLDSAFSLPPSWAPGFCPHSHKRGDYPSLWRVLNPTSRPCKWPVSDYDNKIMFSYKNKCRNFSHVTFPGVPSERSSAHLKAALWTEFMGTICIRRFEVEEWLSLRLPINMPPNSPHCKPIGSSQRAQIQGQLS